MTEEEFDQLIEEERQAIWEEKHGKQDAYDKLPRIRRQ
jgi:hypothetical protein